MDRIDFITTSSMKVSREVSVDRLVDRLAVRTERQRLARSADWIAIVLRARVVPRPRACRLLAIALRDFPWSLQRLRILDHDLRFHRHVVDLAHARRAVAPRAPPAGRAHGDS